jgi:nitrite reductase/ring-hydroxylating ferredoxin subunit
VAEGAVLGHGELRDEVEVLEHHPDPIVERLLRRPVVHRRPVDEQRPAVGAVDPGEDRAQRGLAGTVLPQQGVNLTGANIEVDVLERVATEEGLADVLCLNERSLLIALHQSPGQVVGARVSNPGAQDRGLAAVAPGGDAMELERTEEGRRRLYESYAQYWHPVAYADEVGERPVAVRLLVDEFVVVRLRGEVRAFVDRCVHRGTPLSLGWVDNDRLRCSYHGWAYDCDGACVEIPSVPGLTPRAKRG